MFKDLLNNMMMFSRQLLAHLLMPFIIVVIIPNCLLIALAQGDTRWDSGLSFTWLPRTMGVALVLFGFSAFAWCVSLFVTVGRGTLAPWDPTQMLVNIGP